MLIGTWIKDADGKLVLAWNEQKSGVRTPHLLPQTGLRS